MVFDYGDVIKGYVMRARETELSINADPLLSDQGKWQKRLKHVDPLIYEARLQAKDWLRETRTAYARAQERELAARQAAAAKVDIQKRSYALERARLVAEHSSWDTISTTIAQAVELGDGDTLAAWADLEPMLRGRFDGGRAGPASVAGSGIAATFGHLKVALAAAVDPDVVEAQAALAKAQDHLAEAEHTLTRIDWRRGVAGEGDPLFADLLVSVKVVQTGGPDDPLGWSFETQGGGAFG